MHIFELSQFPNLLPQILLTSDVIRETVTKYKLVFPQERNREVEWGMKLPMFVDAFYNYIILNQSIPSQEESFYYYLEYNKHFFKNLNRPDLESGIKARNYRTYPSLVRDVYFNKFIEERIGSKCNVVYNTKLDIEEGIDLMVITRKNNYGICFFTKTKRGFKGRAAKVYRHTLFDNVKYIEMPMEFEGSVKAGDFFLYGEKEFEELYNELSK